MYISILLPEHHHNKPFTA